MLDCFLFDQVFLLSVVWVVHVVQGESVVIICFRLLRLLQVAWFFYIVLGYSQVLQVVVVSCGNMF